jgi:predicted MFS family arabinose efflux permease
MIQRQQTLWLLLATIAALFTFMFPFATGTILEKGLEKYFTLKAGSDFLLLIATGASLVLSTATIFLYKDRKLQIKLCIGGLVLSAVIIFLYILEIKKISKSTIAIWAILPIAILVGYFMALKNIRKDEKLVKSLDKLR